MATLDWPVGVNVSECVHVALWWADDSYRVYPAVNGWDRLQQNRDPWKEQAVQKVPYQSFEDRNDLDQQKQISSLPWLLLLSRLGVLQKRRNKAVADAGRHQAECSSGCRQKWGGTIDPADSIIHQTNSGETSQHCSRGSLWPTHGLTNIQTCGVVLRLSVEIINFTYFWSFFMLKYQGNTWYDWTVNSLWNAQIPLFVIYLLIPALNSWRVCSKGVGGTPSCCMGACFTW